MARGKGRGLDHPNGLIAGRSSRRLQWRRLVWAATLGATSMLAALLSPAQTVQAAPSNGGNASISLSKTVSSASVTPVLSLTLGVDKASAIPGDVLTYTTVVSNTGSDLGMTGIFKAANDGDVTAPVAGWYDEVEYFSSTTKKWVPIAGIQNVQAGYTMVNPSPITTGMTLTATPSAAGGVTYPSSGDHILGTVMNRGSTGQWSYTATATVAPSLVSVLADTSKSGGLRNVVHFECTPRSSSIGQPFISRAGFTNPFHTQSSAATGVSVTVTLPDGSQQVFTPSTTPALSSIPAGGSVPLTTTFTVPNVSAKGATETDAAYLTRLQAVEGSALSATAGATAAGGVAPASAGPAVTTEQLPIVTITKTGPATVAAGTTETNPLALQDTGGATASSLSVVDKFPAGATGNVTGVPSTITAGGSANASSSYLVPASQPAGSLTDTASVTWSDANGNSYGPLSSSWTTTVTTTSNSGTGLTLAPVTAGPDVTGTQQTLQATLLDSSSNPIVGKTVSFTVTGANPTTGTGTTGSNGVASFTYTGQNDGTDTVQASYLTLQSNTATVGWVTPIAAVSTTSITGRFYYGGCGSFCADVTQPPVFTQDFPTIDFNPPGGTIPGNITGVGVDTRPFTDITTNSAGDFTGAVVAQGNGHQAASGDLYAFDAVFTGTYVVAQAGNVTFNFYSDDGFIFGVGGGATRVGGADSNPPAASELEGYPVMGAYNNPTSPVANSITVDFPAPGSYPYEVDYSECCGGQVALTMADAATGVGVPPAGNLAVTPVNMPTQTIGQAAQITVAAMDASGHPVAGVPVTLTVSGPNSQTLDCSNDAAQCMTDANGIAVFSYVGNNPGTDLVLAGASVDGSPAVSNTVAVPWDFGGGSSSTQPPVDITGVQPADGTVVSQPIPISADFAPPSGQTISSWKVTYQALDPGPEVTLAQGTGTPPNPLATFDPTLLPNDSYAINVYATASGGGTQETTTTVAVYGNLKMGRFVSTFQDLSVPVNGFPMQVQRTYDSIDKSSGDFGVGWHVSVSNFRTAANRQLGAGGWTEYATSCFILCNYAYKTSASHYVTITFPDGHQEVFDFTPQGPSDAFIDFATATTQFTARPGTDTTSTLQDARGTVSLTYGFDGNLYDSNNLPYNPTRFQLTLHDGTVLILDINTGLVSETDPNGNTLTVDSTGLHSSSGSSINFTRDGQGRITQITGPSGQVLNYAYSIAGDLASFTDASGNTETYTYDASHNLLAVTGPGGPVQTLDYDSSGRLTSVTDGSGNTTTVSNDVSGRQQTTLDPAARLTTVYTYDPVGDVVRIDQAGGGSTRTTTYTYDAAGNILSRTDPDGHTTTATYDANGNQLSLTDPSGHVTQFTYNSQGEPTSVVMPGGSVQSATYDGAGNLTSVTHPDGTSSSYTYDSAGDTLSVTDPSGGVAHYTYDSSGRVTSVTDPLGATTSYSYDGSGNLLTITDPQGGVTGYTYDPDGRITGVTDPLGRTQTFTYDGLGRLVRQTDPVGGTSTYAYNAGGQLSQAVNRDGATIAYSYTPDGEMSQVALPGGVTDNYTYDAFGELTGATNANATDTFTYDPAGDILSQGVSGAAQPTASISYTYDAAGNRVAMTGPAGTVGYTYNASNELTGETDPAGRSFATSYDANGQLTSISRPNGVNDTLSYGPGGNLTSRLASAGGPTLAQASYSYDAAGQRTSLTTTSGTAGYAYDPNHELTSAGGTSYSYDAAGNRTGTGYTYNAADRMLASPGATYTYDAEGNRTSRTTTAGVTSYTWDPLHELTSITYPDTTTSSYKYDALGRRVQVTDGSAVTRYLYAGANVIATYDGSNTLNTSYVNGLGTDSLLEITRGSSVYYPVQDGSNSVVALTDGTGAVVERYAYDAYGNQTATGTVTQPFAFTGRELDAKSGLYYYRARYYDPTTGTFLSEDPSIGGNPYSYAQDAPTNYIDPTGGEAITEEAFLSLETNNLDKARAFQKLNACLGGQLLLLSLAMEGYAVTPPDESGLVSRAFANAYTSFLPSQLQGLAQHFINSGSNDAASTDGGASWETKVADKIKEKVQDKVKEKVEGRVAEKLHLPEGTSDFVDGLVSATDEARSVADAANAVAAGDCATAVKLIGDLCGPG